MLHPTLDELTHGNFNKYELSIGIAKSTRRVTEEYVRERNAAQEKIDNRETDATSIAQLIPAEHRDKKAVKIALQRMEEGKYKMVRNEE